MKKLVVFLALSATVSLSLSGCGGSSEPEVIAPSSTTMSAENMSAYEQQMKQGGSSRSSAPPAK